MRTELLASIKNLLQYHNQFVLNYIFQLFATFKNAFIYDDKIENKILYKTKIFVELS